MLLGENRKRDIVIFVVFLIISIITAFYASYLFYISFNSGEEKHLVYSESSSLNYKVWLKENNFYTESYLGEDYDIVASAIDNVEIDFDYLLSTSDYVKGQSYYVINSYIEAYQKADEANNKVWNQKNVIKDKVITKYDKKTLQVSAKDDFKVDYQEYKKKMDEYQQKYAVSLTGNLVIEIEIKPDLNYSKFKNGIDLESRKMKVIISLTDSIITISKTPLENTSKTLIEKQDSSINYVKLVGSIIGFVFEIIIIVILATDLVKIIGIDSKYVRELRKILKTYDSVIVNVDNIKLTGSNVMYVATFGELLDAQSEIKTPILYYEKSKKEAIFAVKHNDDMFVYKMKSSLYEKEKVKKS